MEPRTSHPYYMFDEIVSQPEYLKKLFQSFKLQNHDNILSVLKNSNRIFLVGSGTSYNAALSSFSISQSIFKKTNKFRAIPARELMSPNFSLCNEDVVIAFSHSGETKATFDCIEMANQNNCKTMLVTGNTESRCANIADFSYTYGYQKDRSLAHTITYTLSIFFMLLMMGKLAKKMDDAATDDKINSIAIQLPSLFENIIYRREEIKKIAESLSRKFYVICGNESTIGVAHEASLKFGEVHYTPTISMDIEQIFHGPLVMCSKDTTIIVTASDLNIESRISELFKASRIIGSTSILFTSENSSVNNSDYVFHIPDCHEILVPLLYTLPMHLISYYISVNKKINPDYIRRDQLVYKNAREAYE